MYMSICTYPVERQATRAKQSKQPLTEVKLRTSHEKCAVRALQKPPQPGGC